MANKVDPIAHEAILAELWFNMLRGPRRALAELAYLDPDALERVQWQSMPVDSRMRLVRAMRVLAEISIDCAIALERAQAKIASSPINVGH